MAKKPKDPLPTDPTHPEKLVSAPGVQPTPKPKTDSK